MDNTNATITALMTYIESFRGNVISAEFINECEKIIAHYTPKEPGA